MRFLVVGTSGSGKSTFGRALAETLACPLVEMDTHYWGPDWQAVPHEQFESAVRHATTGTAWVVDGNYTAVRDVLWPRATHVIWLNYPRRVVFSRVLWRTLIRVFSRQELWHGNRESFRKAFLSRDSILLWSISTFGKNRLRYTRLHEDPAHAHLHWVEFRHPSQARAFLERQARAHRPDTP